MDNGSILGIHHHCNVWSGSSTPTRRKLQFSLYYYYILILGFFSKSSEWHTRFSPCTSTILSSEQSWGGLGWGIRSRLPTQLLFAVLAQTQEHFTPFTKHFIHRKTFASCAHCDSAGFSVSKEREASRELAALSLGFSTKKKRQDSYTSTAIFIRRDPIYKK